MDSENDMYSDGDYEEEGYSDIDEEEQGYIDEEEEQSYIDGSIDTVSPDNNSYKVLTEDDVKRHQEDAIDDICSVLSLSRVSATFLLCHYNWVVSNVHDAWFADEEKVRKTVGILEKPVVFYPFSTKLTCRICFRNMRRGKMYAAKCGHPFCKRCWKSYVSISIRDGPGSLMLHCPDPECCAAVGQDMIDALVNDEDKEKYARYLLRSYVEASKTIKWCPAPDCSCAVEFGIGSGSYDVTCKCTHSFCWNCTEEIHRPVHCDTVGRWIVKNSAEAENTNWILVNTKPCPKCKRSIEKNQGCMHMTCRTPCRFEFCWLCLGKWSEHGDRTGGFVACNRYEKAKEKGTYAEEERKRKIAKQALDRYTHHYERWASNEASRNKAIADLQQMQVGDIKKLSVVQCQLESQLKFLIEAWEQIIECRRVLKWTYAYGYYLPEHENAKRQLFDYLQCDAESWLERLHQCAEKDLLVYLSAEGPSEDFDAFRAKLVDLTIVTRNYFENLGRALERDLEDVDSHSVRVTDSVVNEEEEAVDGLGRSFLAVLLGQS